MMKFNIEENLREQEGGRKYPAEIVTGNLIKSAEYNEEYDCLDISYENPKEGYAYRDRIFNPTKSTADWTTPEQELLKVQRKLKHISNRFMTNEQSSIQADSWKDMCQKFAVKLMEHSEGKEFDLKFIWNKDFTFPALGSVRFMRVEGEDPLVYNKWEKENRMINITDSTNTEEESDDLF